MFSAAKIAGRHGIGEAYEELVHITGPAEAGLFRSTKPVGIGAAVVAKAMDEIWCRRSCGPAGIEREHAETGKLPRGTALGEHWDYDPQNLPRPVPEGMVLVPASEFVAGIGMDDVVHPLYDVDDAAPRQPATCPTSSSTGTR